VCQSDCQLQLHRERTFDPSAYRNVGGSKKPVGYSQVTALLRQVAHERSESRYGVDMKCVLVSPYFVRLVDPAPLRIRSADVLEYLTCQSGADWVRLVSYIRNEAVDSDHINAS
jgi:hypothetical protein